MSARNFGLVFILVCVCVINAALGGYSWGRRHAQEEAIIARVGYKCLTPKGIEHFEYGTAETVAVSNNEIYTVCKGIYK